MNEMKKLKIIFLIVNFLIFGLIMQDICSTSFEVETSKGIKTVRVPEGETLEEAFKTVSVLYLEEKWDHEELIEETENLIKDTEDYKEKVNLTTKEKENLLKDYEDLKKLYEKEKRVRLFTPSIIFGAGFNVIKQTPTAQIMIGGDLFERFSVFTSVNYPLSVGLNVGYRWK